MDSAFVNQRIGWIDLLKVVGMYLIIVGHMMLPLFDYIYGVSVPLFFWISGYLAKKEPYNQLVRKLLLNMFIPTLLLILILYQWAPWHSGQEDILTRTLLTVRNSLCGFHGALQGGYGLNVGWFVFTLIVLRLIYNLCGLPLLTLLCVPSAAVVYFCAMRDYEFMNGAFNALIALPFYVLGAWTAYFRNAIKDGISRISLNRAIIIGLLLILSVSYAAIAHLNNAPWMFNARFGNDMGLFFLAGSLGISVLLVICRYIAARRWYNSDKPLLQAIRKSVTLLASGNLFVLCCHNLFIQHLGIKGYFSALLLYVGFLPIIWLLSKYFPFILGKYKPYVKQRMQTTENA